MIHTDMRIPSVNLSKLLSRFMEKINPRKQEINSNEFQFKKPEIIKPEKIFTNDAVKVSLSRKTADDTAKNLAYDNSGLQKKVNGEPGKIRFQKIQPEPVLETKATARPENSPSQEIKISETKPSIEPESAATTAHVTETPDFKAFKESKFDEFKAAWGSKTGDDNYNEAYDFDKNGVIDMVDYLQFGKEFNAAFSGFKQAWGTESEQAAFSNQFDYDKNGVIDMVDYLNFGKHWLA